MRSYHSTESDRWTLVPSILRGDLNRRISQTVRAQERRDGRALRVLLPLLKKSYEANDFLRGFLGRRGKTKLERTAEELLERLEAGSESM